MRNTNKARRISAIAGACIALAAHAQTDPPKNTDLSDAEALARLIASLDQDTPDQAETPPVHPAIQALLQAEYLSESERKAIRIEHGLWTDEDLRDPADRATAALIVGSPADPIFDHPDVPATLRAEAQLQRGNPEAALETLGDASSLKAIRIRAEALFHLARFEAADTAIQPAVDRMLTAKIDDAAELAEGVRALMLRTRLRGSTKASGGDFQTIKAIIEQGRDQLDRLSWRIRVVEAELLYDKHNRKGAAEALTEAIALNPKSAEAIKQLASLSIDSFAFDQAQNLIDTLRANTDEFGSKNPQADLLEAGLRLRQRDPDAALETLTAARRNFPTHPELIAWHAAAQAAAFNTEASQRLSNELQAIAPGSPLAEYTIARVLADARQYQDAINAFDAASKRLPNWSAPQIELGLVLIQAGQDTRAERVLTRALELDPFNARARNSLELVKGLAAFDTVQSDHFIVRFMPGKEGTTSKDAFLAQEMLPVLEKLHARVAADPLKIPGGIGHEPAQKTIIEIMPSHAWFSVRITGMTRIHTMAAATGPIIAMESPQEGPGFTVGPFDWPRVLQHEYTHTVTLSKTKNRIPHWFTEAAAVFCEDAPRDENTWRLLAKAYETETLFTLADINIAFVRPKKPTDRGQAYAQGHWMYQFIADQWGPAAPVALMNRYAAGEREASAFEAELGIDSETFMQRFKDWAAKDLRRVGLLLPEDTPTVPEMLEADRRDADSPDKIKPDRAFADRWLSQYPTHPQLFELAVAIELENADMTDPRRTPTQVQALERLAKAIPIAQSPHRLLARHYLAGDQADRIRAIDHLTFLDAREQNSGVFAIERAKQQTEAGNTADAIRAAERAAHINPFDADIREFAARISLQAALAGEKARFADAARHIEALTVIEPNVEKHRQRLERVNALAAQP